jgi:hypothetical protein
MANRRATFAKRQRETDLKDRAKQKDERRSQKRNEVRDTKGPQIAWDEAVQAVASEELPSLDTANQGGRDEADQADNANTGAGDAAPDAPPPTTPTAVNAGPRPR